jgi:8-oxo-dGTP diphosphatase
MVGSVFGGLAITLDPDAKDALMPFDQLQGDPRERVVSVAYFALVKLSKHDAKAATDAANAQWFPVAKVPKLAFDHAEILATALARLKGKVRYQPIGFELLPPRFTLSELQHLYEAVLETKLDKRNFRKKVLSYSLLTPLKESQRSGRHRPAQLFEFDRKNYQKLEKQGMLFEL